MAAKEDPFNHSLTDLMSGLAAIFLLVALLFILLSAKAQGRQQRQATQYEELIHRDAAARTTAERLERELRDLLESETSSVRISRDAAGNPLLILVLFNSERSGSEGLFFEPGSAQLTEAASAFVKKKFPPLFERVLCPEAESIESIVLEGHTDTRANFKGTPLPFVPCSYERRFADPGCTETSFAHNVTLSAERAQNVFFLARHVLMSEAEALRVCLDTQFTVAGRGEVEPYLDAEGHATPNGSDDPASRRVVLKIKVKPATLAGGSDG